MVKKDSCFRLPMRVWLIVGLVALAGCLDPEVDPEINSQDAGDASALPKPVHIDERWDASEGYTGSWVFDILPGARDTDVYIALEPQESVPFMPNSQPRTCYRLHIDASDGGTVDRNGCSGSSGGVSISIDGDGPETIEYVDVDNARRGHWSFDIDVEPGQWDVVVQVLVAY